jgi:DNA (cytosine-5)-methyltransferase 1
MLPQAATANYRGQVVVTPFIVDAGGPARGGEPRSVDAPLGVVLTKDSRQLIQPCLQKPDENIPLQPFLVPGFSERKGQTPRVHDVEGPCPAICAQGHTHLTQPFLVKFRGTSDAADVELPAPAITAGGTHLGLVEPFLYQVNHGKGAENAPDSNRTQSVKSPLPTICGNRGEWALASAFLTQVSHGVGPKEKSTVNRRVKSLQNPMPALTGSRDWALTNAFLLAQQSGGALRPVVEPTPTIATAGAIGLIETSIAKPATDGQVIDLAAPGSFDQLETSILYHALHPHTGRPLIKIQGKVRELDIFHRMLNERELASATSFPPTYRFAGNKTDAIRQIGNAVPPYVARALIKAFWTQDENVGEPLAA